jgi:putative polyhydroxyalkanoate system protein
MPDLRIHRDHQLGLAAARKVAFQWAEKAETDFGMACTYEEGRTEDVVSFTRSGVDGRLLVTATAFELEARLGFLLGAFKGRIEAEIQKNLDDLLAKTKPAAKKAAATPAAKKLKA